MDLDLYQELILDHNRHPRNQRGIDCPTCRAEGFNHLCGDKVEVFVMMEGDVLADVSFQSAGCAISTASASMMTESVKGMTVAEVSDLSEAFLALATGGKPDTDLGKLEAFAGVCNYPARVKCATLAWHALKSALENRT